MRRTTRLLGMASVLVLTACGTQGQSIAPGASAGASGGTSTEPSIVTIAMQADPPTLDPQKPGGPVGDNFYRNMFDTLLSQDASGEVIEGIATSWEQQDETTWRFGLRDDATFTDGEPVNAEAVKFTIERILEPGAVRNLYTFGNLVGAEVVDEYTVDIVSKAPDPLMPIRVTDLYILPPQATAEAGEEGFGEAPVGSGPYMLKEWEPNQRIVLEANADYWAGAPRVGQLVFRPIPEPSTRLAELVSGNVDLIVDMSPEQAAELQASGSARVETLRSKRVPFIGMNLIDGGPAELQDVRVRQAMNYAVDVEAIVDSILQGHGYPLATIYRPDWPGYDESIEGYPYDPERARALLAEAGYPDGFSIQMQTSSGIINKGVEIAEAVAGQLGEVGIQVEVVPLELNAYRQIVIGGQEQNLVEGLYLWNWGAKPGDPSSALTGFLKSTGVSSYWNNPEFDALVDATLGNADEEERVEGLREIQQMLVDEAPVIFLYQSEDIYGVSERLDWSPRTDQYILGYDMQVTQ